MVSKHPFPYAKARRIAEELAKKLRPYCGKLYIAGSVRRMKDEVGDLDYVAIKPFKRGFREKVCKLINTVPTEHQAIGEYKGMSVNIFFSEPSDVGSQLLMRTGSANFNIMCRMRAKDLGLKLNRYGLFDRETGKEIAGKTEGEIFDALGMPMVSPKERVDFKEFGKKYLLRGEK